MDIFYQDRKTQKIFNSQESLLKNFGTKVGTRIMQRLFELGAAESLRMISHLPPARCHELTDPKGFLFSVDVSANMRLLFRPCGDYSKKPDGGLDLETVKEICILEVKDTHGKITRK